MPNWDDQNTAQASSDVFASAPPATAEGGVNAAPANGTAPSYGGSGNGKLDAVQTAVGNYAEDEPWYMRAAHAVQGAQQDVSNGIKSLEKGADGGIDKFEQMAADGGEKNVDAVRGIPVLEQLAQAQSWIGKEGAEVLGGVGKGAVGMIGGIANMIDHPLDTAGAMEGMIEHIPGLGTPLKALHVGYDMVANGETSEGAAARMDPMSDLKYGANVVKGIAAPVMDAIDKGKYGEAVGQVGLQVALLASGAGGAEAAGAIGEVGEAANVAKIAELAGEGGQAAKVAELASEGGQAAKIAEVASEGGQAAKVADVAGEGGQAAKVADLADEGGAASKAAANPPELRPGNHEIPEGIGQEYTVNSELEEQLAKIARGEMTADEAAAAGTHAPPSIDPMAPTQPHPTVRVPGTPGYDPANVPKLPTVEPVPAPTGPPELLPDSKVPPPASSVPEPSAPTQLPGPTPVFKPTPAPASVPAPAPVPSPVPVDPSICPPTLRNPGVPAAPGAPTPVPVEALPADAAAAAPRAVAPIEPAPQTLRSPGVQPAPAPVAPVEPVIEPAPTTLPTGAPPVAPPAPAPAPASVPAAPTTPWKGPDTLRTPGTPGYDPSIGPPSVDPLTVPRPFTPAVPDDTWTWIEKMPLFPSMH